MIYRVLLFYFLISPKILIAQENIKISSEFEQTYHLQIPLIQELAMGGLFSDPPLNIRGHSRYLNSIFETGDVTINGINFKNVPLSYDVYSDELLTFHPIYLKKISLQPGKITSFVLANGDYFIFKPEVKSNLFFKNGFFQVIWDEEIQILAKHIKVIKKESDNINFPLKFVLETRYFLDINGHFQSIKNGNHLLKLIGLNRKELRIQFRENYIDYRSDPVSYFKFVGRYFSLNN